ncbi:MAG: CPBP family glutamic-type intramembrane protease [Verrucomicrobiales bacterium]|nr:CPBP family glutamic-type intramembrane protease [Verrucomicrobiales bacterium]
MSRKSIIGWLICLVGFIYVLFAFSSIWPLASVDVGKPKQIFIDQARAVLDRQEIDHTGYVPFVSLAVRDSVLDTIQEEQSVEKAAEYASEPNGLVRYYVRFKKKGTPKTLSVVLHPEGKLIGFGQSDDPDLLQGGYTETEFRAIAADLIRDNFGIELSELKESKFDSESKDGVIHYRIDLQRAFKGSPSLNEIFAVMTGGKQVTALGRRVELNEKAKLELKRRKGPEEALSQLGFLIMGIAIVIAYIVFLFQLRKGEIELIPALKVSVVMFLMVLASSFLDSNSRYQSWDPVWPTVTKWIKLISSQFMLALWALVLGWTLLAAGNQIPGGGREKMASFWNYVRFRWSLPEVGLASLRGGAIGFAAGAIAILLVKFFETVLGGEVGLQPRAFFLSTLDRQIPALAIVLFFFPIAVVEEAGYRLFAGMWIKHRTKSIILAILIPAIVFGMIHTSLGFLPPEKPWWGRALLMCIIGIIWGWAFFKFDFLTVVISHFMADVVIFSWPLLMSEFTPSRIMAAIGISVALWPALIWLAKRSKPQKN